MAGQSDSAKRLREMKIYQPEKYSEHLQKQRERYQRKKRQRDEYWASGSQRALKEREAYFIRRRTINRKSAHKNNNSVAICSRRSITKSNAERPFTSTSARTNLAIMTPEERKAHINKKRRQQRDKKSRQKITAEKMARAKYMREWRNQQKDKLLSKSNVSLLRAMKTEPLLSSPHQQPSPMDPETPSPSTSTLKAAYLGLSLRTSPALKQNGGFIKPLAKFKKMCRCNTVSKAPCKLGESVMDIETPALVVCMDKLESNMRKLTETMKQYPRVVARPHSKAHKCSDIGRMQVEMGHSGLCCQTLSEAEAMVHGGLQDIFISNQVIGHKKILRLVNLAKYAKISVCVDDETNIKELSNAALEKKVTVDLVIEVNVGQDRCGVEPGEDVPRLAILIASSPNVNFKGIQCYNGLNQHIRDWKEKKTAVDLVVDKVKVALKALKDHWIDCNYVTGGGTGTFHFEAQGGVFTEVQPGSYIFMDADYNKNLDKEGQAVSQFEQSLFVIATVQSVTPGNRAVLDCGLKGVSLDSGVPVVTGEKCAEFFNGGDEHGIIRPCGDLKVGQQVWLIPGHCDPTVNMHDWLIGLRDGKVENVWRVSGRGPGI